MKKQIIIIGIMLMLLAVGLSGCTDQSGESKFVGTWTYTGGDFYYDTLHLYSDGVLSGISRFNPDYAPADPGTWEANDTHLILHFTDFDDLIYSYKFTSSDTLVLTASWGDTGIYKKS
ncbi:MAG: hypothetical protein KAW45_00100 [Thermoplasmatales archaeon]|nr:hypothetical protein [Thermoplasmatales archaeon]